MAEQLFQGSGTNKALAVAASSYYGTYLVNLSFDGNVTTGWASDLSACSVTTPFACTSTWITYDLRGIDGVITGIRLAQHYYCGQIGTVKDVTILTSATGAFAGEETTAGTYTFSGAGYTSGEVDGQNSWSDRVDLTDISPCYLRLRIDSMYKGASQGNGWVGIGEVEFWYDEVDNSIGLIAELPEFITSAELGSELNTSLPAFDVAVHITSFLSISAVLPVFVAEAQFGSEAVATIPAFVVEGQLGSDVECQLPAFDAQFGAGASLEATLPSFEAIFRALDITAVMTLPAFVGSGYIRDTTNRIIAVLPEFNAAFEPGSTMEAELPGFSATGSFTTSSPFSMVATLPKFKAAGEIGGEQFFTMSASLPVFSAEFSSIAGYNFQMIARLPRFRGSFVEEEEPVDQGIDMIATLPDFAARFKDDSIPVLPSALRYIRNQVH